MYVWWQKVRNKWNVSLKQISEPIKTILSFFHLKSRWQHESLRVWLTSLNGSLHTTWSSALARRKESPVHDLSINTESSEVSPAQTARNLCVTLDDQLSFAANITATTHSYRFNVHNIGRIHPFLTYKVVQVLVQALLPLVPRLQLVPGWCACMYHPTSAAHPECSNPAGFQPIQVLSLDTAPPHPALATGGCWNRIHDTNTCLLCCELARPILHPGHGQTLHLSQSNILCYCQTACYSLTTRGAQLPLNKITPVCCPVSTMVEQTLRWRQDSRNSTHLLS